LPVQPQPPRHGFIAFRVLPGKDLAHGLDRIFVAFAGVWARSRRRSTAQAPAVTGPATLDRAGAGRGTKYPMPDRLLKKSARQDNAGEKPGNPLRIGRKFLIFRPILLDRKRFPLRRLQNSFSAACSHARSRPLFRDRYSGWAGCVVRCAWQEAESGRLSSSSHARLGYRA